MSLRADPKYRYFWDKRRGIPIKQSKLSNIRLKSVLLPLDIVKIPKGELPTDRYILELDDVEARTSYILHERLVSEVGSDKVEFNDCDLVFNKLEPYLGKIVINDRSKNYIGTSEWLPLKTNLQKTTVLFLKYLLLLPDFLTSYHLLKSGKRHARIAYIDLINILIPLATLQEQQHCERSIQNVEKELERLRASLEDPISVIDEVFARETSYDAREYEKRSIENVHKIRFSALQKSTLLRSTVKFHHLKYNYLREILPLRQWIKLKELCVEPIHRGVQPKYDPAGEVLVVKTLNLRNSYLDFTEPEYVTTDFYGRNRDAEVKTGDILVSSTGEGRGKVDIYELEEPAVADTHTSIIRLSKLSDEWNPYFVLYFMRSLLGRFQLETMEIAVKGTPEIYRYQLEQMRIAKLPIEEQNRIVNEVKLQLQEIQNQQRDIQIMRDQIDQLVLSVLAAEN
jgi:restriction endonuclease S subunit